METEAELEKQSVAFSDSAFLQLFLLNNIVKIKKKRGNKMDLMKEDYQLFDRDNYAFKQLKEIHTPDEVEQIKKEYKAHWQKWKEIQLQTAALLPDTYGMSKPKIESWTNGWNLRSHFWSAYRREDRQNENACLAVLLNQKQYQIYLMYQHYKSEREIGSVEGYNQLLSLLKEWSTKTGSDMKIIISGLNLKMSWKIIWLYLFIYQIREARRVARDNERSNLPNW